MANSPRIVENVRKTQSQSKNKRIRGDKGSVVDSEPVKGRMLGELANHQRTFLDALRDMAAEPLQTLMTVLVIAIAMALPGALHLAVENLERLGGDVEASTQITVFVDINVDDQEVLILEGQLKNVSGVELVTFISRDDAMDEFRALSGFGRALDYMEESPLPHVFAVQPHSIIFERAGEIATQIEQLDNVDQVQIDMQWLQRLRSMLEIGEKMISALGVTLGLGVLLAVASTIRLAIQSRTDEIIVIRLVGGTDAYIRRPFLYKGLLVGFSGALVAIIFLTVSVIWLNTSIQVLASLYESRFALHGLSVVGLSSLLGGGSMLGLLGAWLAVERHLGRLEP